MANRDLNNDNKIKVNKSKMFIPKNATIISSPEEVSYLTGMRDFTRPYSSKVFARLFIDTDGRQYIFTKDEEMEENIKLFFKKVIKKTIICSKQDSSKQDKKQKEHSNKSKTGDKETMSCKQIIPIDVDPSMINIYCFNLIKKLSKQLLRSDIRVHRAGNDDNGSVAGGKNKDVCYKVKLFERKSEVAKMKSVKTKEEIDALKEAFKISDKALLEVRKYIEENDNLSEHDIANKLIKCFYKFGAKSLSFEPIVAIDKNSALPHYNGNSKSVFLKDGSIVLIDCGIYGEEGFATDTTRVFVKGEPTNLQKQIYTLVLKVFLNAYGDNSKNGYELNEMAHRIFNDNKVGDFAFIHGLGHGIGINVHEAPPSLSKSKIAHTKLCDGMTFTIEPGLYDVKKFGIRLENSFYRKSNRNVSLVKVGFEKKMIDLSMFTKREVDLLRDFDLI